MQALILEQLGELRLREIDLPTTPGPDDVLIAIHTVGICGSDVHYYTHGAIGQFVVREPLVLGHEASGTIVACGANVRTFQSGDRVCMEPGIPDLNSRAACLGHYNIDPSVRFWATPPVHGVLRPLVVHPAAFTYRLPDTVSFGEGALVEPLAVGMHAATKAQIQPGDVAVVQGAGAIGIVTALCALAGGCSRVILTDVQQPKLDIAASLAPDTITPVNVAQTDVVAPLRPGGRVVFIGIPTAPIALDLAAAQAKEAHMETVFRYANVYPRVLALMASGKLNVKPLITDVFPFTQAVDAFDYFLHMRPDTIKVQIVVADDTTGGHDSA